LTLPPDDVNCFLPASRPSGEWNDEDFDVLADGVVVGRIMKAAASPVGFPWMWTLAFGHHEDRTPTPRLCRDARGRDGGIRQELAAGMRGVHARLRRCAGRSALGDIVKGPPRWASAMRESSRPSLMAS
jgi:hypothetical protein